tara:strand:+ start:270 stop:599 length:330 start_codon:yes stop_codon:yes gene_type:complete
MNNTITKKAEIKSKEEFIAKLKNRLEDSWSSISQVIEELEEFEYEAQTNLDASIENNIDTPEEEIVKSEKLVDFYDYELADLKYDASDLQSKICVAIDSLEKKINNKEV